MIKPGTLVFFRNGMGEVIEDHVGLVTRARPWGVRGDLSKYYVRWTGEDWVDDWYNGKFLVEVVKDNVSEG